MDLSADVLKKMAARVVSTFLVNKVPLSQAVADIAEESKLSSEQIKRLIEISNQVAYLKLLEKATDRTFEFPLADFSEVMAILATPEEIMSKEASFKKSPMDLVADGSSELEKSASEEDSLLSRMPQQEKVAMLNKELYRAKGRLNKISDEEQVLMHDLMSKAASHREDELFIEKVAFVVEEDDDSNLLTKISHLVFGEYRKSSGDELFYDSDVEGTREFVDLVKRAYEIVEEKKSLEDSIAKAHTFLHKQAFAPAVANVARAVASKASKVKDKLPKAVDRSVKGAEAGTFLVDNMNKPKRDVWKSIRG